MSEDKETVELKAKIKTAEHEVEIKENELKTTLQLAGSYNSGDMTLQFLKGYLAGLKAAFEVKE